MAPGSLWPMVQSSRTDTFTLNGAVPRKALNYHSLKNHRVPAVDSVRPSSISTEQRGGGLCGRWIIGLISFSRTDQKGQQLSVAHRDEGGETRAGNGPLIRSMSSSPKQQLRCVDNNPPLPPSRGTKVRQHLARGGWDENDRIYGQKQRFVSLVHQLSLNKSTAAAPSPGKLMTVIVIQ